MSQRVHILATCLNDSLLKNTLLVFDSLRIGFPIVEIAVYGNGLPASVDGTVRVHAHKAGAEFVTLPTMIPHGTWIESLIAEETHPFWICDTDIEFYRPVESWFKNSTALFAGRYEPEFFERWTQSVHMARLHPSLMWFNPVLLRAAMRSWPGKHTFFSAVEKVMVRFAFVPAGGRLMFFDTCAGLHHALGGLPFTKEQNECFTHQFAGTYRDLLGVPESELRAHEKACKESAL